MTFRQKMDLMKRESQRAGKRSIPAAYKSQLRSVQVRNRTQLDNCNFIVDRTLLEVSTRVPEMRTLMMLEFINARLGDKVSVKLLKDSRVKVRALTMDLNKVQGRLSESGIPFEISMREPESKLLVLEFREPTIREDQRIQSFYGNSRNLTEGTYSHKYTLTEAEDSGDPEVPPAQAEGDACSIDGKSGHLAKDADGAYVCVLDVTEDDDDDMMDVPSDDGLDLTSTLPADDDDVDSTQEDDDDRDRADNDLDSAYEDGIDGLTPTDDDSDVDDDDSDPDMTEDHLSAGDVVTVSGGPYAGSTGTVVGLASTGDDGTEVYTVTINGNDVGVEATYLTPSASECKERRRIRARERRLRMKGRR
jgi:hypothetical protein